MFIEIKWGDGTQTINTDQIARFAHSYDLVNDKNQTEVWGLNTSMGGSNITYPIPLTVDIPYSEFKKLVGAE